MEPTSAESGLSAEPGRVPLSERIRFPELKPLASSSALRDLDQFGFFNVEESPDAEIRAEKPERSVYSEPEINAFGTGIPELDEDETAEIGTVETPDAA